MAFRNRLQADLKDAMKSGDEARKTLIRGVMAALKDAEQRKREDLAKKALKTHNVVKPSGSDEASLAAYQQAIDAALAAEKVQEQTTLDEGEVMAVLQKLVKQHQESIEQAKQAGRNDILAAEGHELKLLEAYLPKQMSREELEAEARAVIAEVGASEARDMGKVMGPLMARVQGRADGKMVSDVVRGLLAK
jgi:uncharacterized protein YqeY